MKENNELLNLYIDGELENDNLDSFIKQLETDSSLAEELKAMKLVDSSLKKMEYEAAPDYLAKRIMQKIASQTKPKTRGKNFFIGMVSFLSLIILGILGYVFSYIDFSGGKNSIQFSDKILNYFTNSFSAVKQNILPNSNTFSSVNLSSSNLTFIVSSLVLFILLSAIYLFNTHKTFHQKMKGF